MANLIGKIEFEKHQCKCNGGLVELLLRQAKTIITDLQHRTWSTASADKAEIWLKEYEKWAD
jgi:hypothetical protein